MTFRTSRRLARARGYTAVEVMISVAVLAIGAAGVMAMQRTAIRGDVDARRLDVANEIARTWAERLQRDAERAAAPSPTNPDPWGRTKYLRGAPVKGEGRWLVPDFLPAAPGEPTESAAFDAFGRDLAPGESEHLVFCVNVRLTPLVPNELLRADVRVSWPREDAGPVSGWCKPGEGEPTDRTSTTEATAFHAVYLTMAVRRDPTP